MTKLEFEPFDPSDASSLARWLSSDIWPFHGKSSQTEEAYLKLILGGAIAGEDEEVFWIHAPDQERVGLLRIEDLSDPSPTVDIRFRTEFRGQGLGPVAVSWATRHVFESMPETHRLEGHTRHDNIGMRRVFRACGYVKEAHYREGWPSADGSVHSSIGYGITRADWASGEVSPVPWDDEP